jgi:hypothetical protein
MESMRPSIVVITPVKNEAWCLRRFLAVWSVAADHIIIADQGSTDDSREICAEYQKVTLISNTSMKFNEAERQILLIEAARKLVPGPRLLIAADADEVLSADATSHAEWSRMLSLPPGTVIEMDKPDLIGDTSTCVRFLLKHRQIAYMDDGASHTPSSVHSTRIPCRPESPRFQCKHVVLLHYNLVRPQVLRAKRRMYCVIEALAASIPLWRRWVVYDRKIDWREQGVVSPTPVEWLEGWTRRGIDMHSISESQPFWQDYEVLRLFSEHGIQRFAWDDIWDVDWEALRQQGLVTNVMHRMPTNPIKRPSLIKLFTIDIGKTVVKSALAIKRSAEGFLHAQIRNT